MSERSLEEEIKIKAQQAKKLARYMSSTEDLVENQILKAQQEGKFDNLPGSGQPINLEENPFEPPELRMAFKLLKDNDFAPYWIELGKEIDADLERLWQEVDYFRRYTRMVYEKPPHPQAEKRYENKKDHFIAECRINLENVSRKIIDYNLHCPAFTMGRSNINVSEQLDKVLDLIDSARQ